MSIRGSKRCPQCGKRPYDQLLETCPECRVAYAYEYAFEPVPQGPLLLTPSQVKAVGWQILRSGKFWGGLVLVVLVAAWSIVPIVQWSLDRRTASYLGALDVKSSNRLELAYDRISLDLSQRMSNQVVAEFRSARIQDAVEQVARDHARELLTNAVWPSLETFRQKVRLAETQFAESTNAIARLSKELREGQRAATPLFPATADDPARLSLVSHNVTRNGTNYVLTLIFKKTDSRPMGNVDLVAGTFEQTAKILNFTAPGAAQADEPVMNEFGDAAQLKFTVARGDVPVLVGLELTAPTIVRLTGDALEQELVLPVAASRMQPPPGDR
jgi:hypothetical protein